MSSPTVGLFVTCLIDLFRPSAGFAAIALLEDAGCQVEVPEIQTCCGQPAYNSGDRKDAILVARGLIDAFAPFDYVVVPSGSCAGMIRHHYPGLFAQMPELARQAQALADKTHELVSFLVDVLGVKQVPVAFKGKLAYHDSCSALREMGIHDQPRQLLSSMDGAELVALENPETCCGFGGTFCVKYPEISGRMVDDKARDIEASGADTLVGPDLGCLLNMAGKLRRRGAAVEVRHVAEVLAGKTDKTPPIAADPKRS